MKASGIILTALIFVATAPAAQAGFSNNGDGTVSDWNSGFVWQRCSAPSKAADCSTSAPETYTWDQALTFCNDLVLAGRADWRLPNVKELQSLLDMTTPTAPSINAGYFPDTQTQRYWTSTTGATMTRAWYVDFDLLIMSGTIEKTQAHYVRCVRGG